MNLYFFSLMVDCQPGRRESILESRLPNGKEEGVLSPSSFYLKNGKTKFYLYFQPQFSISIDIYRKGNKINLRNGNWTISHHKCYYLIQTTTRLFENIHEVDDIPSFNGSSITKRLFIDLFRLQ